MYQLDVRILGGREIEVLTPVYLEPLDHTIPQGFISDGVSVPRYLHWFLRPFGEGLYGALVHDYLLSHPEFSRTQADWWMRYYLKRTGVSRLKYQTMYIAVAMYTWLTGQK